MDETKPTVSKFNLSVPAAIIIAGVLIAGAIFLSKLTQKSPSVGGPSAAQPQAQPQEVTLQPVDENDHIFGQTSDTKVYVVEFSNIDCIFCKRFHPTVYKIVENYGGQVAWVYRHFSFTPDSIKKAEATECASEQGGSEAFWKYLDKIMEIHSADRQPDPNEIYNIAKFVGLNEADFKTCLDSGKYASKVEAQYQDGLKAGVQGTPMSFIVTKDGKTKVPFSGAQPYENLKAEIDKLLK